jgi:hypothetical protein
MPEYEFTSGEPVDPAYSAFKSGLVKAVAESSAPWRWSGRHKNWLTYDQTKWLLEDLQLADTPPGDTVREKPGIPPTYEVQALSVPTLFKHVQEAATAFQKQYPKLNPVWRPFHGGNWRGAHDRTSSDADDTDTADLPESALQRIARVRAFEERDDLTADDAREMIRAIIAEYT